MFVLPLAPFAPLRETSLLIGKNASRQAAKEALGGLTQYIDTRALLVVVSAIITVGNSVTPDNRLIGDYGFLPVLGAYRQRKGRA